MTLRLFGARCTQVFDGAAGTATAGVCRRHPEFDCKQIFWSPVSNYRPPLTHSTRLPSRYVRYIYCGLWWADPKPYIKASPGLQVEVEVFEATYLASLFGGDSFRHPISPSRHLTLLRRTTTSALTLSGECPPWSRIEHLCCPRRRPTDLLLHRIALRCASLAAKNTDI